MFGVKMDLFINIINPFTHRISRISRCPSFWNPMFECYIASVVGEIHLFSAISPFLVGDIWTQMAKPVKICWDLLGNHAELSLWYQLNISGSDESARVTHTLQPIRSMVLLNMVTFTINIPPMLHIYHTWILWAIEYLPTLSPTSGYHIGTTTLDDVAEKSSRFRHIPEPWSIHNLYSMVTNIPV